MDAGVSCIARVGTELAEGNGLGTCGAVPAVGVAASCRGVERMSERGSVLDWCICVSRESELSHCFQPGQTRRSWLAHEIVAPASSHPN